MKSTPALPFAISMIGAIAISACAQLPAPSENSSSAASVDSSCATCGQAAATRAISQSRSALPVESAQLAEKNLKTRYINCSRDAMQRHISASEAAYCSTVYETLLQRVFGGDFHALLAWSRAQRYEAVEDAAAAPDRNP